MSNSDIPFLDPGKRINQLEGEIAKLTTRDTAFEGELVKLREAVKQAPAAPPQAQGASPPPPAGSFSKAQLAVLFAEMWDGDDLVFVKPDGSGRIVFRRVVDGADKRVALGAS